jgi:hypothetical protein
LNECGDRISEAALDPQNQEGQQDQHANLFHHAQGLRLDGSGDRGSGPKRLKNL